MTGNLPVLQKTICHICIHLWLASTRVHPRRSAAKYFISCQLLIIRST